MRNGIFPAARRANQSREGLWKMPDSMPEDLMRSAYLAMLLCLWGCARPLKSAFRLANTKTQSCMHARSRRTARQRNNTDLFHLIKQGPSTGCSSEGRSWHATTLPHRQALLKIEGGGGGGGEEFHKILRGTPYSLSRGVGTG